MKAGCLSRLKFLKMFRSIDLDQLNKFSKNTLLEHLSIRISEIGDDYVEARMPVTPQTHQPMGFLHGGATLALAESVGSFASFLVVDPEKYHVFGLEINANHLKSKKDGELIARAKPIHLGSRTQVWDIKVKDENEDLIAIVRLTNMIVDARK